MLPAGLGCDYCSDLHQLSRGANAWVSNVWQWLNLLYPTAYNDVCERLVLNNTNRVSSWPPGSFITQFGTPLAVNKLIRSTDLL